MSDSVPQPVVTETTPAPTPEPTATPVPDPVTAAAPETEEPPTPETEPEVPAPVRNVTMSDRDYGAALQKEREKGKRSALREYEDQFKTLGFNSLQEALAALSKPQSEPEPATSDQGTQTMSEQTPPTGIAPTTVVPPATPPAPPEPARPVTAQLQRELERTKREAAEAVERASRAERTAKEMQHARDVAEARGKLERSALTRGLKDVDYGIALYERSLKGKTEEELAKSDEGEFFEGLRKSHPYLFGEVTVPATTGQGGAPGSPSPADVARVNAPQAFDARTATKAEFDARLKTMRVDPNAYIGR